MSFLYGRKISTRKKMFGFIKINLGQSVSENISRTPLFWYTTSLNVLFNMIGILYYIKQSALKMNNVRNKVEPGVF